MTDETFQTSDKLCLIGIYVKLPPLGGWFHDLQSRMLAHIIQGALYRRSLLCPLEDCGEWGHCFDKSGRLSMAVYETEIWTMAPVTNKVAALRTITQELSAVDLIDGAHVAWYFPGDGVWHSYLPDPETIPWDTHVKDFRAWLDEPIESKRSRMFEHASKLLAKVSDKPKHQP